MSIRAGIIGFGYMGHFHLQKSNELGVPVVAICDIDEERLKEAEEGGMKGYSSLEAFLADDSFSLVYICTPNNLHAPFSIAALNAGKHVMCEKPVTMNSEELEQVIAAAEKNRRVFTSHYNRRWDEDYLVVKDVIGSGEIGRTTTLVSRVYGQRGVCFGWRSDPAQGGGMLYDWGIHLIDQILALFKGHKVVSLYAHLQSILTPAVDDSFELLLRFDDEAHAVIQVGTFCLIDMPRWFVYGDRGMLKLDGFSGDKGQLARIRENVHGFDSVFGKHDIGPSRTMAPLHPEFIENLPLPEVETDRNAFHRNLFDAIEGKADLFVTYDDLRRDMKIIDLAFESSRLDQVMKVEI